MYLDDNGISRAELFESLAEGGAARMTVVTPNQRLSQALHEGFGAWQAARGLRAWETPDILPFRSFVERLWDDALHGADGAALPQLASAVQEQALWEEAVVASPAGQGLLAGSSAAAQCRAAWALVHGWGLSLRVVEQVGGDDARAFAEWSRRYVHTLDHHRLIDGARLPERLAPLLGSAGVRRPATLVLYAFDLLLPQQTALLEALREHGVAVRAGRATAHRPVARRVAFATPDEELLAAARWARTRLEAAPGARIGLVVPGLAQSRERVRRVLADVLHPGHLAAGEAVEAAFNLSAGQPLDTVPLAHDALALLRLCGRQVGFEEASRLVRSPFVGGAEAERGARARLDAQLRRRAGPHTNIDALLAALAAQAGRAPAPNLQQRLARLAEYRRAALFGARAVSEWAKAFSEALQLAGFPGERALDSLEFQALERWHEALSAFATLERVTGRMGFGEALGRLARVVRDTVFQPRTGEAPIQVLGVLESAGLEFDHLWVSGLTDEAWPLPPRPNPFVPLGMQRAAGIPNADPAASAALDRRLTQGWLAAAAEVVVSHARMDGERELGPSPLVAQVPPADFEALEVERHPVLRDVLHGAGRLERIEDAAAPPLPAGTVAGGTALFKDQAACPFRAFARHRLRSRGLDMPQPGLAAPERGTLAHEMLRAVWAALESRERLLALDVDAREALLERCADEAIARGRGRGREALRGRFARLEKRRLVGLARGWLELEAARADFTVVDREARRPLTFGGITVDASIDRIDRLSQGGLAVLDYKTGAAAVSSWLGPRPDEPQVPMYALACGEDVRAVAFARLKPGELQFCGLAMEDGLLPGVRTVQKNQSAHAGRYGGWGPLLQGWQAEIEALARGIASGDARVDPKSANATCRQCDQQPLCRVAEKASGERVP